MKSECVPNWKPLEFLCNAFNGRTLVFVPSPFNAPAKLDINDFMYMATYELNGVKIMTYKHRDTRRYLNLSEDGAVWKYVGSIYERYNLQDAIMEALS